MTEYELKARLVFLDLKDEELEKTVVCSLIGHSKIFFDSLGFAHCARCGKLLRREKVSVYLYPQGYILDEKENLLSWEDKFMVDYVPASKEFLIELKKKTTARINKAINDKRKRLLALLRPVNL